jgi:DNA-binding MurR/RpiR family transcriptional regulator
MSDHLNGIDLLLYLKKDYPQMSAVEKKIAGFFITSIDQIPDKTVTEIADICDVSEASIIRFAKKMGYSGFYQMKIELAKSSIQGNLIGKHNTAPESVESVKTKALNITLDNIRDSYKNLSATELEKAVQLLATCKNVFFFAAGNSYPPCLDFMYKLGRLGIRGYMSEIPERSLLQARNMEDGDIAFILSHSGDSTLVYEALRIIKKKQLPIIGMTNYRKSPIIKLLDITLTTAVHHNMFSGAENLTRITETSIFDLIFYTLFYIRKEFNLQYISQTESDQSLYSL